MSQHRIAATVTAVVAGLASAAAILPAQASGTATASPHVEMHPWVMAAAAQQNATAKVNVSPAPTIRSSRPAQRAVTPNPNGPFREVFGFVNAGNLGDGGVGYTSWNFQDLSTVAFFGLHVNSGDGNLVTTNDSDWTVWNSPALSGLVSAAHASGVRVVVSIILQDFSGNQGQMCRGLQPSSYANTIPQTISQVQQKGLDGINVDYEGLGGVGCGDGNTDQLFTNFISVLRSSMNSQLPGDELTVDSYAGAAEGPGGFFNIPNLKNDVDAFFVMAYDMDFSNYASPPTSCPSYCLGPTSPLTGYRYNDTLSASQYVSAAGASKVILGFPYYGYKSCVGNLTSPHQAPTGTVTADTYLDNSTVPVTPGVSSFTAHRDANDPAGQERWDTWYVTNGYNCDRELYWDDTVSLGAKYDLVNSDGLRGAGIFTLDYGGGASELWDLLASKFVCRVSNLEATAGGASAYVTWSPNPAGACNPVSSYTVTSSPGGLASTTTGTGTSVSGLTPGLAYTFTVTGIGPRGAYQPSPPSNSVTAGPLSVYTVDGPTRVCDTRGGQPANPCTGHRLGPAGTLSLQVAGTAGVPQNATAAVLNVTVTGPTAASVVEVYPSGLEPNPGSALNFRAGQTVANLVTVALDGGSVTLKNAFGSMDAVIDLQGYYAPPTGSDGAGHFVPNPPARILDTRASGSNPAYPAAQKVGATPVQVQVGGLAGVPMNATAVVLNATVTNPTASSVLTLYPAGGAPPGVSNLNYSPGQTVANRAVVPLGANGQISVFNAFGSTDVVLDVNGYFLPAGSPSTAGDYFQPLPMVRIADTRRSSQVGPVGSPVGQAPVTFQMAGSGGIPGTSGPDAPAAAVLNVTTVNSTALSDLDVYPQQPRPVASDVNFPAHAAVPNQVVVALSPSGTVQVYSSSGTVDVVIDVEGFFTPA